MLTYILACLLICINDTCIPEFIKSEIFHFAKSGISPNSVLFGGTVPPNSVLFGGTKGPLQKESSFNRNLGKNIFGQSRFLGSKA